MLRPASDEQWARLRADVGRLVARRLPTSADVEDVVQDVLLRVWRHGDQLRADERFGAWLSRVAYTAAADQMRGRQGHPLPRFASEAEPADAEPGSFADDPAVRELIAAVLRPFAEGLPEPYRQAVLLSELEDLSQPLLARRLGLSLSGVKSRVQRGRRLLREALERCCAVALDARGGPVSCEIRVGGTVPRGCCPDTPREDADRSRGPPCPPPRAAGSPARRGRCSTPSGRSPSGSSSRRD
jgi:RNA polymerase sigma-70 factor (ECF subfamily)